MKRLNSQKKNQFCHKKQLVGCNKKFPASIDVFVNLLKLIKLLNKGSRFLCQKNMYRFMFGLLRRK